MHRKNNTGAITVYLSIILSSVIMLSGVLMDIVRIRAAEVQVRRAVNTAAISTLACYNTKLKEDYGLFALHSSDAAFLSETIDGYLSKNLLADISDINGKHKMYSFLKGMIINNKYEDVSFINLYDYKIEGIEVTPLYNFTENEITRQQIIEYMKYRAPVQFAENFMEKIDYVASSEELTSAYKQKTAIERRLGKIDKAMKRLQEHIDVINKFEKRNFDCSLRSGSQLVTFCRSIILEEIYKTCRRANFGKLETPEERAQVYAIRERINQMYEAARIQATNSKVSFEQQIVACNNAIIGARQELLIIEGLSKQARQDIDSLKLYLQGLRVESRAGKIDNSKMIAAMQKDIDRYEDLLGLDKSADMYKVLDNNQEVLSNLRISISNLYPWVAMESRDISVRALEYLESSFSTNVVGYSELDALLEKLTSDAKLKSVKEEANKYKNLVNILDKGKSNQGNDPRKSTAEAVKRIRKEIQGTASNPKIIENPKLLPSYFIGGCYPNKIYSEDILSGQEPDYNESAVVEQFDADFDEDSSFVDESFDYIIDFAKTLKDKALDMRDEIYVNEYILKIFKDVVEIDNSNTDGKSKSTFFEKGEVEYILGGNANEGVNKYLVKGQILLLRFGMNTLHIYSDSGKRLQALEIATAIAGFTGFGIPIAHNLIICTWGAAEAVYDIKDIYDGKKVPFIKTAESWKTDLLPSGFQARETVDGKSELMDFDYHDYLRLLLLVKDEEVKMNRIEDLVQLNTQQGNADFKLNSSNTYIKIDAVISIRYWFITKLFVPSKNKTIDGDRHIINVEVWRGY